MQILLKQIHAELVDHEFCHVAASQIQVSNRLLHIQELVHGLYHSDVLVSVLESVLRFLCLGHQPSQTHLSDLLVEGELNFKGVLGLEFEDTGEATEKEVTNVDIFVETTPNLDQFGPSQPVSVNVHIFE